MYRELMLVRKQGMTSLDGAVEAYAKAGWKLYESPFELSGIAVQPMVKDDTEPALPENIGKYRILEKTGTLTVESQARALKDAGWLFYAGPFSLNGLAAQAMTLGNMPRYIAQTAGASQAYNALKDELIALTARDIAQQAQIDALIAGGGAAPVVGYLNYANTLPAQEMPGNAWGTLKNNGAGPNTQTQYGPAGVSPMLDAATGKISLLDFKVGDQLYIRHIMSVTPYMNGLEAQFRHWLGNTGQQYSIPVGGRIAMNKGAGNPTGMLAVDSYVHVRDENTRTGGVLPQIYCDGTTEVEYGELFISVVHKQP